MYSTAKISEELGLCRQDLVAFAYFLGSDYCDGIKGIGIVNALEIIEAFPMREGAMTGLRDFVAWLNRFDAGLLEKNESSGVEGEEDGDNKRVSFAHPLLCAIMCLMAHRLRSSGSTGPSIAGGPRLPPSPTRTSPR